MTTLNARRRVPKAPSASERRYPGTVPTKGRKRTTSASVALPRRHLVPYVVVQVVAAVAGVLLANAMFGEPLIAWSRHERQGSLQALSEFVATFGLLTVIWGTARSRPAAVPFAVGAYITAAYWFTPSTSFANPAVTIARAFTDTFAGIRPIDVPAFIAAQFAGAIAATALFRWLTPALPAAAERVVVPHEEGA
jgi:glycerol uptake facilitator-like aquaporin